MSNEKHIEESFEKAFDPSNVTSQGWNDPSDTVWENITETLDQEKRSRLGLPFFLVLSALLISLIGTGYMFYQNNQLEDRIIEINNELEECGEKRNHTIPTQNVKSQSVEAIDIVPISKTPIDLDNTAKKPFSKPTYKKIAKQIVNHQHIITIENSDENNLEKIIGTSIIKDQSLLQSSHPKRSSLSISNIGIKKLETVNMNRKDIPVALPLTIDPVEKYRPDALMSFTGGLIGSQLLSEGSQGSSLTELIDREYADLGYQLSVNYSKGISKNISFSAGLGINYQSYITEYDITLPYDINLESVQNGEGFIDFEHSLPTSFGNTDTGLRLRRADPDIPLSETSVNIDFDTRHRFISLDLPLSIDYHFNSIFHGVYMGLDLMPFYVIDARSGISSVISRHSAIESVNNTSNSSYSSINKFNIGLGVHIGYRYAISEKQGLDIRSNLFTNLNDHFQQESFSSKSRGVSISTGYYFNF